MGVCVFFPRFVSGTNISIPTHYFAVLTSCRNSSLTVNACVGELQTLTFLLPHRHNNLESCKVRNNNVRVHLFKMTLHWLRCILSLFSQSSPCSHLILDYTNTIQLFVCLPLYWPSFVLAVPMCNGDNPFSDTEEKWILNTKSSLTRTDYNISMG